MATASCALVNMPQTTMVTCAFQNRTHVSGLNRKSVLLPDPGHFKQRKGQLPTRACARRYIPNNLHVACSLCHLWIVGRTRCALAEYKNPRESPSSRQLYQGSFLLAAKTYILTICKPSLAMQQSIFTVALIMGLMGGNTVAQPVNKPIRMIRLCRPYLPL